MSLMSGGVNRIEIIKIREMVWKIPEIDSSGERDRDVVLSRVVLTSHRATLIGENLFSERRLSE